MYCFPSRPPHSGPYPKRGLGLVNGVFPSCSIASLHFESNVLTLDLRREVLAVKALLHPYLLPSSPLGSLLASEDLACFSWKFALLVHTRFFGAGIVDFNVLEFKYTLLGLFFMFVLVYSCRSWLKLPTPFLSNVLLLWSMRGCTPHLFPSVLMGPSLVRVSVVPLFFLILTCSCLFL